LQATNDYLLVVVFSMSTKYFCAVNVLIRTPSFPISSAVIPILTEQN
jgi:hypothetical protein